MTATVRTLTKVISAHLGVDTLPYAAALAGAGWLPSEDQPVDVDEAAMLLAAVLAAPEPENAAVALIEVFEAEIESAIWSPLDLSWPAEPATEAPLHTIP